MAYRMHGTGEELVAAWEHVYILRRTDRWRVSLAIADGEMAEWAARWSAPLRVALPQFSWIIPRAEHGGGVGPAWRGHSSAA